MYNGLTTTFVCEDCGKETEEEPKIYSRFIKCDCGGRAFEKGFDPSAQRSNTNHRGGL